MQAETLKKIYLADDVAILKSKQTFTFQLNPKQNTVSVLQKAEEELLNISDRSQITKYVFYDETSRVSKFNMFNQNGKNLNFEVTDQFYHSDEIFYSDARVKHMDVIFPSQGYVLKYELEKEYDDIKYFTRVIFEDEYPVLSKEITLVVPDWLQIEFKEFHFGSHNITLKKERDNVLGLTKYIYTIKELGALKKEKRSPGISHTVPHILVLAQGFNDNNEKKVLFKETRDLYNWYKSLIDSMEENEDGTLKSVVEKLTENVSSDEEKIRNIYYWVQDNIRYIAFEDGIAGFRPDESQNVLKKMYGDCKGMANLLKQMLITAGLDARLTWIGTNEIAYDYSLPSLAVDNHMICSVFKDGKILFLDGTEKYIAINQYAERIQGRPVLIENGSDYILEKVPYKDAETNQEVKHIKMRLENETLKGNVLDTYSGESKSHFLYGYHQLRNERKEEGIKHFLNSGSKDFTINNINTSDLTNRDIDVQLAYDFELENKVSTYGKEIYIELDYAKDFSNLIFEERKSDYMMPFKMDTKSIIELQIPIGYTVVDIPEPIFEKTDTYEVSVDFSIKDNFLIYEKHFVFPQAVIRKSDFDNWDLLMQKINTLYNQQLILVTQ